MGYADIYSFDREKKVWFNSGFMETSMFNTETKTRKIVVRDVAPPKNPVMHNTDGFDGDGEDVELEHWKLNVQFEFVRVIDKVRPEWSRSYLVMKNKKG